MLRYPAQSSWTPGKSVLFYFSTLTPDVQTAIGVLKTIVPIRGVTPVRSSTGSVVIEVTYKDSQDNKKAIQEGVKLNGQVVKAYDTLRKSSAITQIRVTRVPHVSDKEIIDVLSSILSTYGRVLSISLLISKLTEECYECGAKGHTRARCPRPNWLDTMDTSHRHICSTKNEAVYCDYYRIRFD
ncbi:hypothetical protein BC943DRAFT_355639 [Umbelopsis sp. AD052]|nr:hypothetical protein BC943DRAFT_355639 [Umbelopsis sp. AD052]